jgi:hypothetical protein
MVNEIVVIFTSKTEFKSPSPRKNYNQSEKEFFIKLEQTNWLKLFILVPGFS